MAMGEKKNEHRRNNIYLMSIKMRYQKEQKIGIKVRSRARPLEKRIKRASSSPSTSQCRDLLSFVYAKMFRIFVVKHDFSIFA